MTLFECEVLCPPQDAEPDTLRVPLRIPAICGAKHTYRLTVCCGARVIGRLGLAKVNPVPETVAEIVALALYVFVIATGKIWLFPTCTLKLTFDVEAVICPSAAAEINNGETMKDNKRASLWETATRLMCFALFCTCSLSTGGGFGRALLLAAKW